MEKTEKFGMVFSPAEKRAGERLAEIEGGLSLAALVRRLIRTEAHQRGLWPPAEHRTQPNGTQGREGGDHRQQPRS
jgi:hypothetical protein